MAAEERDHVSHLIDTAAAGEDERNELRLLVLHNVNRHEVLSEIDSLAPEEKRHVFDRCVQLLTSDRALPSKELGFLKDLRRRCGIGWWRFHKLMWRLRFKRRIVLLAAASIVAVVLVPLLVPPADDGAPPQGSSTGLEIMLAPIPMGTVELAPEDLYQLVRRSVVTVNVEINGAPHGNGSGSVIGADRHGQLYVLTNKHVVFHRTEPDQALTFTAELESGVQLPTVLDFYSRGSDLAVLVVPGLTGWAVPLPVLPGNRLQVGQRVYAVGSPLGLDHTFTAGLISALRPENIQTDATVHSGSSGGPLLDAGGAVCGVITSTHQHKDMSFALYGDAVFAMLEERRAFNAGVSRSVTSRPDL
jgi:S1-C subfamily serine protease